MREHIRLRRAADRGRGPFPAPPGWAGAGRWADALAFGHTGLPGVAIVSRQVRRTAALEAIWRAVRAIPPGQVATYGAVARRAGLAGRARLVGYALKVAPEELDLPWHRVVASGGRIAFPPSSRLHAEQRRRLRAEGIEVVRGRVRRAAATLDELLWKLI